MTPKERRLDDLSNITVGRFYQSADFYLGLACLEPEASIARHQHHGEDEAYFVLEGRAEVTLGSSTAWVLLGTYVSIPKGLFHKPPALPSSSSRHLADAVVTASSKP